VCGLSAAALRDDAGIVTGALFTLLDVTNFAHSEDEADRLRGVVQVLRFRASFDAFARDLDRELRKLEERAARGHDVQSIARRALHTAKGVLGQFRLVELARLVHRLEDEMVLTGEHFARLRRDLGATLQTNAPLWGISLAPGSVRYSVPEAAFAALRDAVAKARSVDEACSILDAEIDDLRRRPISELIGPIQESALSHAERVGKQLEIRTSGLEREVPERLMPVLSAIGHLTRNAIDHAIEPPEERGTKSQRACLEIRVARRDDTLVIEVEDDGRGIDRDAVLSRAIAVGLLTPREAGTADEARVVELLFHEGFSTSASVSETSGRGVGLAAVRGAVRTLGGSIEVESRPGRGTCFRLSVPLGASAAIGSVTPPALVTPAG
jgi:chemotaxis protein histidine kinase CheA